MDTFNIQKLIYSKNKSKLIEFVSNTNSEEELFILINNYNWDDGFEIPKAVLDNKNCTLNVALLTFFLADGITYLFNKDSNPNLPDWKNFISELYNRIINNYYTVGLVAFSNDLSKIEKYKLSKIINEKEKIILSEFDGTDCNILLN